LRRWYEQVFSPGRAFQDLVLLGVGLLGSLNLTGEIDDQLERGPLALKPTVAVCSRPRSKTKGPSSAASASEEIWFVGRMGSTSQPLRRRDSMPVWKLCRIVREARGFRNRHIFTRWRA
jgi:hypothetical protein